MTIGVVIAWRCSSLVQWADGTNSAQVSTPREALSGSLGYHSTSIKVVVRGDDVFAMTAELKATYGLDDDNWPTDATYDVAGEQYEFIGPKAGSMTQFSESRWANYRTQYGQVRRVDDDKIVTAGLAWVEGFGNRIIESGLRRKV